MGPADAYILGAGACGSFLSVQDACCVLVGLYLFGLWSYYMVSNKDSKLLWLIFESVRLVAAALAGFFGGNV